LSLFVRDGAEIRRVLHDLVIESSRGEWDGTCVGSSEERRSVITVAPGGEKGYADLIVTTTVNESETRMVGEECVDTGTEEQVSSAILRYDGSAYVLPREAKKP
jgi:hypothetical protein